MTERLLRRDGEPVPLTPKAIETLIVLVENHGHLVEKDHLMQTVWRDTFVEEGSLKRNISVLRKVLGENSGGGEYIETIPRRGYRFVTSVRETQDDGSEIVQGYAPPKSRWKKYLVFRLHRSRLFLSSLAGLLLLGLVGWLFHFWTPRRTDTRESATHARSIAVLPFQVISGEETDDYLGLGVADALITKLGALRQLIVRPTSATRRYTDLLKEPAVAGRELGVDFVLDGHIQKSGGRIRVTVQLISVNNGSTVWTERFDESLTDIFELQDSIAEKVARSLLPRLGVNEHRELSRRFTESTEAYQAYVKGLYFWDKRTEEGFRTAIQYFEQAIGKDPGYALAYAGLADCYHELGLTTVGALPPREAFAKAKEAALKALELDNTLAEAHSSLAHVKATYDWDWTGAEREHKRAIELNPNSPRVHQWYGIYLETMGRIDEGIAELRRALELDPLSLTINMKLGWAFYLKRDYDGALEQLRHTLEMEPKFPLARIWLGRTYLQKKWYDAGIAELKKAENFSANRLAILSDLGYGYAISGRRKEALAILEELKGISKNRPIDPFHVGRIYIGLGEKDQAFEWLAKAAEERSSFVMFLKVQPAFDGLRSDPRFTRLLQHMRLTP